MVFYCERNDQVARAVRRLGGRVAVRGNRMVVEADRDILRKAQLQAGRTVSIFHVDKDDWDTARQAWLWPRARITVEGGNR